MAMLPQVLMEGIFTGMIVALIAMSVSLTWGVMSIVNFAQGEILMLGMFVAYYFTIWTGLDPLFCIPIVIVFHYFLGIGIYKLLIKRVMKASTLSQLLVTYALSIVLVNVAQITFGPAFKTVNTHILTGSVTIGALRLPWSKLVPLIICVITATVLYIIINKTKLGRSIKATALNRDAAALIGVNAEKAYMTCMGIATAVSGIAGIALTYYFAIYPSVGSVFMTFGFTATCIGGMGSIPGALVGGLLMGIVDSTFGTYFNVAMKYVAVFAMFIVVVYKKPKGFFGW